MLRAILVAVALSVNGAPVKVPQGCTTKAQFITSGHASWFNDSRTASGRHGGISTWFYGKLNGYWRVTSPNGIVAIHRQNDNGPARRTGRWLDLTPQAVYRHRYDPDNFPTDIGRWKGEFIGYRLPRGVREGVIYCNRR